MCGNEAVTLNQLQPSRISVIVPDNGVGFDITKPAEGMGLGNVRSRAAALGGKVQVDSSPGKGTTVSVECPVIELESTMQPLRCAVGATIHPSQGHFGGALPPRDPNGPKLRVFRYCGMNG